MGLLKFFRSRLIRKRVFSDKVVDCGSDDSGLCRATATNSSSVTKKFTWEEMKIHTKNFSTIIGLGGFSTVYLAHFPDSALAAVKITTGGGSERLHRVYEQELQILLRIRHPNIVKFLGHCTTDQENDGVLVLEYVCNGTLHEKLHDSKVKSLLPWKTRMLIAFQLAQVIEYLHENCGLQIIHGDIKASNLLLDENLNCKLCDFGSSKLGFSSMVLPPSSSSSSSSRNRLMMMGSQGYTDPHYLRTGVASKKTDVYSYGVVLLELITGKEAFSSEKGEILTAVAGPMMRGEVRVEEMVDPSLESDEGFELDEATAMVSVAKKCLGHNLMLRPSATQIVAFMRENISILPRFPN